MVRVSTGLSSGFGSVEVVEQSARTSRWASWKLSAVFVGLLPWFIVPPVLDAIGVTGIWYPIGLFAGAFLFVALATVWLVPSPNGRVVRSSPRTNLTR